MGSRMLELEEILSALNAAGNPWEAGVTSLSSVLHSEQKRHLGFMPPPGVATLEEADQHWRDFKKSQKAETTGSISISSVYDLRNVDGRNFVTPFGIRGIAEQVSLLGQ